MAWLDACSESPIPCQWSLRVYCRQRRLMAAQRVSQDELMRTRVMLKAKGGSASVTGGAAPLEPPGRARARPQPPRQPLQPLPQGAATAPSPSAYHLHRLPAAHDRDKRQFRPEVRLQGPGRRLFQPALAPIAEEAVPAPVTVRSSFCGAPTAANFRPSLPESLPPSLSAVVVPAASAAPQPVQLFGSSASQDVCQVPITAMQPHAAIAAIVPRKNGTILRVPPPNGSQASDTANVCCSEVDPNSLLLQYVERQSVSFSRCILFKPLKLF